MNYVNTILNFLKIHWKYIVVFLLGVFVAYLFLKQDLGIVQENTKIVELEKQIEYWKGAYDQKEKERAKHAEIIRVQDTIIEQLKSDEAAKDKEIQIIDQSKYKEREKIANFSEKELFQFYKNLNK
jgi:uncharacterized protein (DUF3084 family)